jgi:hypothetical protein
MLQFQTWNSGSSITRYLGAAKKEYVLEHFLKKIVNTKEKT